MRSVNAVPSPAPRERARVRGFTAAFLLSILYCTAAHAAPQSLPTEPQIHHAIEQLEADPNLARTREVKTLKRRESTSQRPRSAPEWLSDLMYWFAQSIQLLMWLAIGLLVIAFAVLIILRLKGLERSARREAHDLPTHVHDLDIRPESLPDDIGASALALWNEGEHRAALALLYRGLLSRLVHLHDVPIKASSTEGDFLQMVQQHLPEQRLAYAAQLVRVWQRAVYGARDPDGDEVRGLCLAFDAAVGTTPPRSA